ncbi:MAG: GTPase ObgE [Chlorobi bacterium]|nr:GTPase ObgE [Chlorobiota bacterium]
MFVDFVEIEIKAGDGGDGAVAFRREKYVPKGGPAGGNGGKGGDVVFLAERNLQTLLDFRYRRKYEAENGNPGGTSLKDGRSGEDLVIRVPVGTIIKDAESGKILSDLNEEGMIFIAAHGGRGGKGNSNFATPTNQTPRFAEEGKPGEERKVSLELKLIAEVGLVGFPNAGKSTLISSISAAKPKIADYPFTTLAPNLGIVQYKEYKSFTVADIPGIIEGAHEGKGLGHRFLRHIERTKILLILIDVSAEDIQTQYDTILAELEKYSEILAGKKKLLAFSKADLLPPDEVKSFAKKKIKGYDGKPLLFSSVSRLNLDKVLDELWKNLSE